MKHIDILYGCSDQYAPHAGISITSLFENNRGLSITVYFAGLNLSPDNREKLVSTAQKYDQQIVFLDTSGSKARMDSLHCSNWNGSPATWLRYFVLDQIPLETDLLVWLDSDTIVYNGLGNITDYHLEETPVAAVCDCLSNRQRFRLNLQSQDAYYNAGVLVFNLAYWRANNTLAQMMAHLAKNIDRYPVQDQDLLNDFFRGKIYRLPPQYNSQCFLNAYRTEDYFSVYPWPTGAYYSPEQIEAAKQSPVVVHFFRFLGDYPWQRGNNYHPAKGLYESWKAKSLWKDDNGAAPRTEISFRAEKLLYRLLPRKVFLRVFAWYTNRGLPKEPIKQNQPENCNLE